MSKPRKKREKRDEVFVPWQPGQRTMATAGRTKINTNIEKGHFGPIPGVEVGQRWQYRIQLSELGVHAPPGKFLLIMFASQLIVGQKIKKSTGKKNS